MASRNWKWYVEHDDLLGCYERFEKAYINWKDHWWKTVEEIYNTSSHWAKEYILDPIERTIRKVIKTVKKAVKKTSSPNKGNLCYWVRLIGKSGTVIYNKIGTSTSRSVDARIKDIIRDQYKDGREELVDYTILQVWDCGQQNPIGLESELRGKLMKKYSSQNFEKNDRFFIGTEYEEPTFEEMNGWAMAYLN